MERSQSLQDKILWELASHDGKLTRSVLRRRVGIRYADLDPVLDELERGGEIRRTDQGVDKIGLPKQMITFNLIFIHKGFKIRYRPDFSSFKG